LAESPYTGLKVDPKLVERRPVVVMIDNSPKARPQAGLNKAQVIYEMLAEGGITRFEAVYLEGEPATLGPVRSARHYFVYTAAGYDSVYAHCGGSPQAFQEIAALKVPDLDDLKDRGIYWRSPARTAPNNLYTSMETLRSAMALRGWERQQAPPPQFKFTDTPKGGSPAGKIKIPYPKGYQGYTVDWEYDSEARVYRRFTAGEPHIDSENGTQLTAKTVMVLYIKSWPIPGDQELRIDMEIIGSGKGAVFSSGKSREIKWTKESKTSPFSFYEASGAPLEIERGQVFIQVVPLETEVAVTQ
jgi:hypothetical protein